ncbi:MAG: flavodoxin family protein [Spirochaetaceae bacterium]
MKKTVIGIHSGRKGKVSEESLTYLLEHTGIEYRLIALRDVKLETCDACLGCLTTHRCVKDDGVNEIVDALTQASAVVFAAPEYWDGVHGKARAFWERVCFMGRHNESFPLRHLYGVILGISGHGDASAAIRDLSAFFEDARITIVDTVDIQGTYACFKCGFGPVCEVAGLWDIYHRDTEIEKMSGALTEADSESKKKDSKGVSPHTFQAPSLSTQDPHLCKKERRPDVFQRLDSAAAALKKKKLSG